mgnify:CR=1 FL=1
MYRPRGIVFMGMRKAEEHQNAIAEVAGDMAVKVRDCRSAGFLENPQNLGQILRIKLFGQGCRAHQIDEHHCQLASFRNNGCFR